VESSEHVRRDQEQWQFLLSRQLVSEPLLLSAWQDPRRSQDHDLVAILTIGKALSLNQAGWVRGQLQGADSSTSAGELNSLVSGVVSSERARETSGRMASSAPKSSRRLQPVEVGPYRIVRELGRGGMGVVYEAQHENLSQRVALKLLPAPMEGQARERFEIEGQTMLRLRHPNIVRVIDLKVSEEESYMALEMVTGGSLRDRLDMAETLEPDEALELTRLLGLALHYAHLRGVIHRDMKPGNVLLGEDGAPLITDFGLAKELGAAKHDLTKTGDMLGTPSYMAPEQIIGAGAIDGRADVYALGVTLYEALTGELPFEAETTLELIAAVLNAEAPSPRSVDPELSVEVETILARCLAKEPVRRYESAAALAEDCRRAVAGERILAEPIGWLERLESWQNRHHRTLLVTSAIFALIVVAGAVFWIQRREAAASRRGERLAKEEQLRAESARIRAEKLGRQAELDRRRAESSLAKVKAISDQLSASRGELVEALEASKLSNCKSLLSRAQGELAAGHWDRAALYAAEAQVRAKGMKGAGAHALAEHAAARFRSAQFQGRCRWRYGRPLSLTPRLVAANGAYFALGNQEQIQVWHTEKGEECLSVKGGQRELASLAVSRNGRWLAAGEGRRVGGRRGLGQAELPHQIRLWDIGTGRLVARGQGHTSDILALLFRGEELLSLADNGELWRWSVSGKILQRRALSRLLPEGASAVFTEEGTHLLLAGRKALRLVELAELAELKTVLELELRAPVRAISASRNGSHIAVVEQSGAVQVYSGKGKKLWSLPKGSAFCAEFSPNRLDIVLAEPGGMLSVRDPNSGAKRAMIPTTTPIPTLLLAFTKPNRQTRLIGISSDRRARLFDWTSSRCLAATSPQFGPFSLGPEGKLIAAGVQVLELASGKVIGTLEKGERLVGGHWKRAKARGSVLMLLGRDGTDLYRLDAGGAILSYALSPNGRFAVLHFETPEGLRFGVWDLNARKRLTKNLWSGAKILGLSLNNSGEVSYLSNDRVLVFDGRRGVRLLSQGINGGLCAYAFSPRGNWLAVSRLSDGRLSGRHRSSRKSGWGHWTDFAGHRGRVTALAASPDGKLLASGGTDRLVIVRRMPSGEVVQTLYGHAAPVTDLCFAKDGLSVVSKGGDLRCWSLPPPDEPSPVIAKELLNPRGMSASGEFIGGINIWRAFVLNRRGEVYLKVKAESEGLGNQVRFSRDGRELYTFTGKTLRRFNLKTRKLEAEQQTKRALLNFWVLGRRRVYGVDRDGRLLCFRHGDLQPGPSLKLPRLVVHIAADAKGRFIAMASRNGLGVVDAKTFRLLWFDEYSLLRIDSLVLSESGESLVVSSGREVRFFRPSNGHLVRRVLLDASSDYATELDPFGKLAAGLTPEGELALWDTATGSRYLLLARKPLIPQFLGNGLSFSQDGGILITAEREELRLFDTHRVREALGRSLPKDPRLAVQAVSGLLLRGFEVEVSYGTSFQPLRAP